ncbi:hypothetical protein ICW40_11885 [Actinotalea ferrariae]|uniref:hypothetical protein n=1 Tax=Actinotalea ferrariae TaxID=1386098 RepID=UPI001C8C37FA|nr:hypothetical protein [Actinotalea ferrariae]MBX9245502.1 hypothetical protein [Actinotalea ferrariae]
MLTKKPPVDMVDAHKWVVGRPIETDEGNLFPVASGAVKIEGRAIMGTVRLALLIAGDNIIRANGYRFESAEVADDDGGMRKPHTFPHTQPCRSWTMAGACLLHPDSEQDAETPACWECEVESENGRRVATDYFNGHKPALPLRCRTLPGLAVAALAGVYGAPLARTILDTQNQLTPAGCPPEVTEDIDHILGLDGSGTFSAD